MYHTPPHKLDPSLPQAGTIEARPYEFDGRAIVNSEPDFTLGDLGSICLLDPVTDAARAWANEYLPYDASRWGRLYAIERRFVRDILDGIEYAGLEWAA